MRPSANKFPDTDKGRGLLFTAQLLREMLQPYSFESFRVRALDTMARLREMEIVLEDVRLARIPRVALNPITAELQWSLNEDPVASSLAEDKITEFEECLKQIDNVDLRQLRALVRLLITNIGKEYRRRLEDAIVFQFEENVNRKNKLRIMIGYWASHVVNSGYTREYLLTKVTDQFFSKDIQRAGAASLRSFFKQFSNAPKTFVVYVAVNGDFARYLRDIGETVRSQNSLPAAVRVDAQTNQNFSTYANVLVKNVSAYDDVSAAQEVRQHITSLDAVTYLNPKGLLIEWCTDLYVRTLRSENGRHISHTLGSLQSSTSKMTSRGRVRNETIRYSKKILTCFDDMSTERLLSSIGTAALAKESTSRENQLISLWSSVEVLLSDPAANTVRIAHYDSLLVPCICLRYVRRQIVALYEQLRLIYGRKFNAIISEETETESGDVHLRLAAIILLERNRSLMDRLQRICGDNPLALHRLYRVQQDYGSLSNARKTIRANNDRVSWQLHRIYRTRNNLVHAGRVPSYLDELVLNMYEYYRTAVATLVKRAGSEARKSEIDQTVYDIGVNYRSYLRSLSGQQVGNVDSVQKLRLLME